MVKRGGYVKKEDGNGKKEEKIGESSVICAKEAAKNSTYFSGAATKRGKRGRLRKTNFF